MLPSSRFGSLNWENDRSAGGGLEVCGGPMLRSDLSHPDDRSVDERWKSPEIRAAESELGAAIESADEIITEAVRAAAGAAGPGEPKPPRDERDDGEDTFLRDAW